MWDSSSKVRYEYLFAMVKDRDRVCRDDSPLFELEGSDSDRDDGESLQRCASSRRKGKHFISV